MITRFISQLHTAVTVTVIIFYASARHRGIMFSGCPSVSACIRPSVRHECFRACFLLPLYLTNLRTEFHQTLVGDVVEDKNELISF